MKSRRLFRLSQAAMRVDLAIQDEWPEPPEQPDISMMLA
jgi:hypothetical protein